MALTWGVTWGAFLISNHFREATKMIVGFAFGNDHRDYRLPISALPLAVRRYF